MFLTSSCFFLSIFNYRELQAKAKRLARFRNELSEPEPSDTVNKNQKPQQVDQLGLDKRKASDMTVHNSNLQTDGDDQDSSTVIIGYCPDMCPGTSFISSLQGTLQTHLPIIQSYNKLAILPCLI